LNSPRKPISRGRVAAAVAVAALVAVAAFVVYESYLAPPSVQSDCVSVQAGTVVRSQVSNRTFGAITEFALPGNDTWPSAITTGPDGSVWFVEQAVPGVANLFPNNGTLVQYSWPGYKAPTEAGCFPTVSSSGIALWDGRVWGADEFGDVIYGINPTDGSVTTINSTGKGNYPYWLAPGPDGNLWVSFDDTPAELGRIFPNGTMSTIDLVGTGEDSPLQIDFVNSSLAFLDTINLSTNSTTQGCVCNGHIYSFDPSNVGSTLTPTMVGAGYELIEPTSVTYSQGRIWVAQHYSSSVVSYDFQSNSWTKYPTSLVPWTNTTLPLFIAANGSDIWFNEHYANKIALIRPASGTLTEVSESDPPASTYTGIQNDEYIAMAGSRVWFTSMTGNYVGYIEAGYGQTFGINATTDGTTVTPGGNATLDLKVTGTWAGDLKVGVSDSEGYFSIPTKILVTPSVLEIPSGTSAYDLSVGIQVSQAASAGEYTIAVTVTDGGIQQSAYFYITVT